MIGLFIGMSFALVHTPRVRDRDGDGQSAGFTTIGTFLMVFLIQNVQNRDARAMHLKLDELLGATPDARNEFMEAEEEALDEIEREKEIVDKDDPAPPADKREGAGTARVSQGQHARELGEREDQAHLGGSDGRRARGGSDGRH